MKLSYKRSCTDKSYTDKINDFRTYYSFKNSNKLNLLLKLKEILEKNNKD